MKKMFITCLVLVALGGCKKEGNGRAGSLWSGTYSGSGFTDQPYVMEFTGNNTLKFHDRNGTVSAAYEYDESKEEMEIALPGSLPHFIATVTNDTFTNIINISASASLLRGSINTTTEQKLDGAEFYGTFYYTAPTQIKLRFTSENSCVTSVNGEPYMPTTSFVRKQGIISFVFDHYGYEDNFYGIIEGNTINATYIINGYTLQKL